MVPIQVVLPRVMILVISLSVTWNDYNKSHFFVIDYSLYVGNAVQYLMFALQYLRSGLTVPIYFEIIHNKLGSESTKEL